MMLNKVSYVATVLALSLGAGLVSYATTAAEGATHKIVATSKDEESAIRKQLTTFTNSLAAADPKSLAGLWTIDGVYIDADGNKIKGQPALENRFSALSSLGGKRLFEITPETISVLGDGVGKSEGTVSRKDGDKTCPETRYLMVFVKQNGHWLISSAVETPISSAELADRDTLADLSWMVGDWKAEQNGASVHMKADWAGNKNFIQCRYEISKPNQPPSGDVQVIGWDPVKDRIVSWLFDASGGTGHGTWSRDGHKWIVESYGTEHDGSTSHAVNVIDPTDPNSFLFQSLNRSVDGVALGDTVPLKVERIIQ